jgi:sulfofructose kinase
VRPRRHVACIGSANLDHVLELDVLPAGEGKQLARGSRWSGGGLAATAAVAVSSLEGRATWCGLAGDDSNGLTLTHMLMEAGVELCDEAVVPGARTPVAAVLVDLAGRRWLGWHAGEGLETTAVSPQLPDFAAVDAVLADAWSVSLSTTAFRQALAHGIPRVLDWELADPSTAFELAELADHVIFSAAGLVTFIGIGDVDAALRATADRLPETVVAVSLGPEGSAWVTEDGVVRLPAPRVPAHDTTGCGDVFHGAYALGIGEGMPVPQAATFATAAAALKAERGNGWSGMPDRSSTESLMARIQWA